MVQTWHVCLALVLMLSACDAARSRKQTTNTVPEDPSENPSELKGNEGKGYGFPLYALGRATANDSKDENNDVLPMDLAAKLEISMGQCGAFEFDANEARNDDEEYREKHKGFEKWLKWAKADYDELQSKGRLLQDEAKNETGGRELNIFLPNDIRVMNTVDMDTYPARTVGRLVSVVGTCTATIIQEDLVLTNRHCLGITSSNELPTNFWSDTYIQLGLTQSAYNYKAYFGRVRWSATSKDYAILQLLEPIGLYTGWPGIKFFRLVNFIANSKRISYIGYSGVLGGNAGGHFNCRTRNGLFDWDDVHHDCDATRGSSGSALMEGLKYPIASSGTPYIVALNFGEYRDGGSVSLTLPSYERSHRNVAKAAGVFKDDFYKAKKWAPFPTKSPTNFPTNFPTKFPTKIPTRFPTELPTKQPTKRPTKLTFIGTLPPFTIG